MPETKHLLERAGRSAPRPAFDLDDVRLRGEHHARGARRRSMAAGLVVIAMLGAGAFALLERGGTEATDLRDDGPPASVNLPAAWAPLPVAAIGEYHFTRTEGRWEAGGEQRPDAGWVTFWDEGGCDSWWAADGSGRLRCRIDGRLEDALFAAGGWPSELDTTGIPTTTPELTEYLLAPTLASPVPDVTPTPGASATDTRLWHAAAPLVTVGTAPPRLTAAALDVLAGLDIARVDLDTVDPVGRAAYRIRVVDATNGQAGVAHDYYVDPATHALLAYTELDLAEGTYWTLEIVTALGVAPSTDVEPDASAIPAPLDPVRHVLEPPTDGDNLVAACSQGGPELQLRLVDGAYDRDCFVVEAGSAFSISFEIRDPVDAGLSIVDPQTGEQVFVGEMVRGPQTVVYDIPAPPMRPSGDTIYAVVDVRDVFVGYLYLR